MHGGARGRWTWPRVLQLYAVCASALAFGFVAAGCQNEQGTAQTSARLSKLALNIDAASTYQPALRLAKSASLARQSAGTLKSAVIAPEALSVRVTVTAPDFGALSQNVAFGATSLTFLVPQGPQRVFTLLFLDAAGAILGSGTTTVDVSGDNQTVNITIVPGVAGVAIATTSAQGARNVLQNRPFNLESRLVNNTNASLSVQVAGHRFRMEGSLVDMSGSFAEVTQSPSTPFPVPAGSNVDYVSAATASNSSVPGRYQIDGVVQGTSTSTGAFTERVSLVPTTVRLIREHRLTLREGTGTAGFQDRGGGNLSLWNAPTGITALANGDLVVADTQNNRVRLITTSANGTPVTTTILGIDGGSIPTQGTPRIAPNANVVMPTGVALLSSGQLLVAESGANRIVSFAIKGEFKVVAGNGNASFGGEGQTANSNTVSLDNPQDVVVAPSGAGDTIYIADTNNHVVRKIEPINGIITTIAGAPGIAGNSGDGGLALSAQLMNPHALALDADGNLLIAQDFIDTNNAPRGLIRRVDFATRTIATIAGSRDTAPLNGAFDPEGRPALLTRLGRIGGMAIDPVSGFTYFTEQSTGMGTGRVLLIDPEGNLRTVAGTGANAPGASAPGTDVSLARPERLLVNGDRLAFPASEGNNILELQ